MLLVSNGMRFTNQCASYTETRSDQQSSRDNVIAV